MQDGKITNIKEKQIAKSAKKSYDNFIAKNHAQNPIHSKLLAFSEAKKKIDIKDLF